MNPIFERELADIWIEQMRAITDLHELERYAADRASKFKLSKHLDELRQVFGERKEALKR